MSVRLRLTLWNMGVLSLVLALLDVILRFSLQATLLANIDYDLARRAQAMSRLLHADPSPTPLPSKRAQTPPLYPTKAIDPLGQDAFTQSYGFWDRPAFERAIRGNELYSTVQDQGEPLRILSSPFRKSGRIQRVIQVAAPLTEMDQEVARLTRVLIMLMPLALAAVGVGGAFLTNRALRPVRQITRAAGRIEATDLSDRLSSSGRDEFSELATTFNGMLGRLENAFEQQRRFTADASHELRTPLAILKAGTSLALQGERSAEEYRRALSANDRMADRMNRIVQDLLFLAQAEGTPSPIELSPIVLQDVLEQAVEGIGHPGLEIETSVRSEEPILVTGDMDQLLRLFTNLLENAARHTPEDGGIKIRVRPQGRFVVIAIADTGEGIAPEHLPHVCDRFYRVDSARSRQRGGTGLGLAICRIIVETHHGHLNIESALGQGTTVFVKLPSPL